MCCNHFKVKKINTNEIYDCYVQSVELNFDGKYYLRYVIGIKNYQGFHWIHCIYSNDEFNATYKVIEEVNN